MNQSLNVFECLRKLFDDLTITIKYKIQYT